MKRGSTSLAARETHTETTIKCHCYLEWLLQQEQKPAHQVNKNLATQVLERMLSGGDVHALLVGMKMVQGILETSLTFSYVVN